MPITQILRFSGKLSETNLLIWISSAAQLASLGLTTADNMRFKSLQGGVYMVSFTITPAHSGFNVDSTVSVSIGGPRGGRIRNSFTSYWPLLKKFNELDGGLDNLVLQPGQDFYVACYVQGYNPPQNDPDLPPIMSGQLEITKLS